MSISTSRASYLDCYQYYDQALEEERGIRIQVQSYDYACHLRQRLHMARKIRREDNAEIYPDADHPMHGASPYDIVVVKIKTEDDGKVFVILEKIMLLTRIEALPPEEDLLILEDSRPKSFPQIEQDEPPKMLSYEPVKRRL